MLPVDSQVPLFLLEENLGLLPETESMRKDKRKHGNQVVHIVTVYENKCHMMRPFGGRNLEFGVNHVLQCLFHVCTSCFLSSLEYWCFYVLCLNVLLLHVISIHMILF